MRLFPNIMSLKFSVTVRNARGDAIDQSIGTSPIMRIYSGAIPADCSASETGSILATLTLPAQWLKVGANGQKTLNGGWSGTATGSGTATHFRIYDSGLSTCHAQGSITLTDGDGDIEVETTLFQAGQPIVINSFTINEGN